MPNRRRFRAMSTAEAIAEREPVISPQDEMQVAPGELDFVEAHTDLTGLDPIETSAGRGTKTTAERDLQAQRILPHRSNCPELRACLGRLVGEKYVRRRGVFKRWTQHCQTLQEPDRFGLADNI